MGVGVRVRALAVALMLMTLGCVAPACTPTGESEGTHMTPQQLSEKGDQLYAAVQTVFGADGWNLNRQWFACDASADVDGVSLHLDSRLAQTLPAEPHQLVDRVQGAWRELGVDAEIFVNRDLDPVRYILSNPPFMSGVNDDGSITDLWVGTGIANFGYVSPCVPGDIFELQPQMTFSPEPPVTPPSSP